MSDVRDPSAGCDDCPAPLVKESAHSLAPFLYCLLKTSMRTHPCTGRKALYVTAGECIGIEGLPHDEGVALIEELHAHCLRPEFQYRHRWQVGDLLMWDNATSMHIAICDYELPQRRLMHRTTVAGTVPV